MRQHLLISVGIVLLLSNFAAAQRPTPLPASVDLVPEYQKHKLAPEAQGDRDVCSLFAITSLVDFETARGIGPAYRRRSVEFLIWAARKSTGHKGEQAMFYEAVHGLNALGVCTETLLPYGPKPALDFKPDKEQQANAHVLAHRWHVHWIRRWDVKRPTTEAELLAIKKALAAGHPVACGLRWPKNQHGSAILAVPRADEVFDGHSIALVGYEDGPARKGGVFLFRNSNGPGWGKEGYGRLSYAYIRAYANDALWLELGRPKSEVPAERFEAARLRVIAKSDCQTSEQNMSDWGGSMWSQGRQLFGAAQKDGHVALEFEVRQAGRYRLRVLGTAAPNYGKIHFLLDGKRQGPDFDLYCGRISPAGSLELGTHELTAGRHTLGLRVVGKNAASTGFYFGLDAVDLLTAND